jgi:hypothetical protein
MVARHPEGGGATLGAPGATVILRSSGPPPADGVSVGRRKRTGSGHEAGNGEGVGGFGGSLSLVSP